MGWAGAHGTRSPGKLSTVKRLFHMEEKNGYWISKCMRCGRGYELSCNVEWDRVLKLLDHANECGDLRFGYPIDVLE